MVDICGFLKIYNEGSPEKGGTGNLRRCLENLTKICGKGNIAICDDSSTDDSVEIAKEYTEHIISMPNIFQDELLHKQKLLEYVLENINPKWVLWCDGDEIFEQRAVEGIPKLCEFGDEFGIDCFNFHEINLWSSKCWFRTDNAFNGKWDIRLWKNNGKLKFPDRTGLHTPQHPEGLAKAQNVNLQVIHFGFSDVGQIARKYATYQKLGQSGWALERLRPDSPETKLEPANLQWFSDEDRPKIEPPFRISTEEWNKACQKYL